MPRRYRGDFEVDLSGLSAISIPDLRGFTGDVIRPAEESPESGIPGTSLIRGQIFALGVVLFSEKTVPNLCP